MLSTATENLNSYHISNFHKNLATLPIILLYIGTYKLITRPARSKSRQNMTRNCRRKSFFGHKNGARILIFLQKLLNVEP